MMSERLRLLGAVVLCVVGGIGCGGAAEGEAAPETPGTSEAAVATASDAWCPTGFSFDSTYRQCVSATEAAGPFTAAMIATCKANGGGTAACESTRWAVGFMRSIRGTGTCPPGATLDAATQYCLEGDNAFGPFTAALVSRCKSLGGGTTCETNRWHKSFLPIVSRNPLTVPYFYQYANVNEPGNTCGLTSAAMLLNYYGKGVTPDGLYTRFGKRQGQSPDGLAYIYRQYGLYAASTYTGTQAMIKRNIDAGRPVVVHGYFTDGHILVVIGYDSTGWIVNDPAGLWAGCYLCGYPNRTSTNGRGAHYSYSSMSQVISYDGDVWMSTASTSPFTL